MDSINKEWIVGFIEGEGCFNISERQIKTRYRKKDGTIKICKSISTIRQFRLGLDKRDLPLLKQIQKIIGGKIYTQGKNIFALCIQDKKGREKLIKIIDSTSGFKGNKKLQYEEWKRKIYIS